MWAVNLKSNNVFAIHHGGGEQLVDSLVRGQSDLDVMENQIAAAVDTVQRSLNRSLVREQNAHLFTHNRFQVLHIFLLIDSKNANDERKM